MRCYLHLRWHFFSKKVTLSALIWAKSSKFQSSLLHKSLAATNSEIEKLRSPALRIRQLIRKIEYWSLPALMNIWYLLWRASKLGAPARRCASIGEMVLLQILSCFTFKIQLMMETNKNGIGFKDDEIITKPSTMQWSSFKLKAYWACRIGKGRKDCFPLFRSQLGVVEVNLFQT